MYRDEDVCRWRISTSTASHYAFCKAPEGTALLFLHVSYSSHRRTADPISSGSTEMATTGNSNASTSISSGERGAGGVLYRDEYVLLAYCIMHLHARYVFRKPRSFHPAISAAFSTSIAAAGSLLLILVGFPTPVDDVALLSVPASGRGAKEREGDDDKSFLMALK